MTALAEAIDHLLEANTALRKRRSLAKPERTLTAALSKAFTAEGRAVLAALARLKPKFPKEVREAVTADDLVRLYDRAVAESTRLFVLPIDTAAAGALESGMAAAVTDLGIDVSFTLKHPEAVKYLKGHGAEQVKRIRQTTREGLRSILTQAADEGWSYDRAAKAIRERYKHFSKERSRNIAVYETGFAYEEGGLVVARDLAAGGLDMQHAWKTAGDDRVRAAHLSNQAQGFIPLETAFSSGDDHPPSDPKCRCFSALRRKPE